jgi:hypothetical protein
VRTLTASHRAIVATTVGLVVSIVLAACSQSSPLVADAPSEAVGCSLSQFHGDLVAENGRAVLKTAGSNWGERAGTVPLDWPGDWTIRPTDGGQLEVVDVPTGVVLARTGTRIILLTRDYLTPFDRDGEFVVCGPASPG